MEPAGQLPRHCGREATRPRRGAECPEAQISCLILQLMKKRVADPVREEARKGPPSIPMLPLPPVTKTTRPLLTFVRYHTSLLGS